MIFSLVSAMLDYLVYPIIAFSTMDKVRRQTGSDRVGALVGIAGFLFCLWAPGHLLYGLVLVAVLMTLAILSADAQEPS